MTIWDQANAKARLIPFMYTKEAKRRAVNEVLQLLREALRG